LHNKDQEYNNPLTSFATCLYRQRIGHERNAQLGEVFRSLAVMTWPWWASRSFIRPCLYAKLYKSRDQTSTRSTCFVTVDIGGHFESVVSLLALYICYCGSLWKRSTYTIQLPLWSLWKQSFLLTLHTCC